MRRSTSTFPRSRPTGLACARAKWASRPDLTGGCARGHVPPPTARRPRSRASQAGYAQGAQASDAYARRSAQAVGVSMGNVVRAEDFLTDMRDFAGVAAAWSHRYGREPHPFAAVQVPGPLPTSAASIIGDFWIYAGVTRPNAKRRDRPRLKDRCETTRGLAPADRLRRTAMPARPSRPGPWSTRSRPD